jgi:hypothetical protein
MEFRLTMNEALFFHVHIGKCAGTTFNNVLRENFAPRMLMEYPMLYDVAFPREHIRWYVELYNYRCISSHNLRWNEIPYEEFPGLHAISFVREPVRRLMSNYYYQRTRKDVREDYYVNRYPLVELVNMVVDKELAAPYSFNSQLQSLVGDDTIDRVKELAYTGHFQLFQTERFNEACVLLEKLYPNDLKDCAYPKPANRTSSYTTDDQDVATTLERLPYVETDRDLHRFAGEYMDALIDRLFRDRKDFQLAQDEFVDRCQRKAASFHHFLAEKKNWIHRKVTNSRWWNLLR